MLLLCAMRYTLFLSIYDDSLGSSRHIHRLTTPHIDITCTHNNNILYVKYIIIIQYLYLYNTYLPVGGRKPFAGIRFLLYTFIITSCCCCVAVYEAWTYFKNTASASTLYKMHPMMHTWAHRLCWHNVLGTFRFVCYGVLYILFPILYFWHNNTNFSDRTSKRITLVNVPLKISPFIRHTRQQNFITTIRALDFEPYNT